MKQSSIVLDENPVVNTGRWAIGLMKNKLVASVMLLIQGILFIAAPQGKSRGTVQIASVIVILACAVNIVLHIRQKRKTALSCALILLNAVLLATAIFCLISPQTVEPYVRIVCGVITLISGLINLIETLKIEKKKNWRFAVGIIAAIVTMALGTTMIFASVAKIEMMQQSIGVFLILNALINIWYILRLKKVSE